MAGRDGRQQKDPPVGLPPMKGTGRLQEPSPAHAGIEPDPTARPGWKKTLKVECPHCGEVHGFPSGEAYITLAVQDSIPPGVPPRLPKRFIPRKPTKRIHASGEQRDDGLINMRYPMGDLSGSRGMREALVSDPGAFPRVPSWVTAQGRVPSSASAWPRFLHCALHPGLRLTRFLRLVSNLIILFPSNPSPALLSASQGLLGHRRRLLCSLARPARSNLVRTLGLAT